MRLNMRMYENLDSESVDGEMDSYNATRAVSLLNSMSWDHLPTRLQHC